MEARDIESPTGNCVVGAKARCKQLPFLVYHCYAGQLMVLQLEIAEIANFVGVIVPHVRGNSCTDTFERRFSLQRKLPFE
jgi:hypothetical protein